MSGTIPRFLLPRASSMWWNRAVGSPAARQSIRNISNKTKHAPPPKQRVLEKPAKFNPPSHGARLRKDPPRYPGPALSEEEALGQKTKAYPNMMPPPGTFFHWFLNNRSIHIYITLVRHLQFPSNSSSSQNPNKNTRARSSPSQASQ